MTTDTGTNPLKPRPRRGFSYSDYGNLVNHSNLPEDAHRLTSVRCFIQTAIEQGHTIRQCFFQSAGVMAATQPEQLSEWQQIAMSLTRSCCFAVRLSRTCHRSRRPLSNRRVGGVSRGSGKIRPVGVLCLISHPIPIARTGSSRCQERRKRRLHCRPAWIWPWPRGIWAKGHPGLFRRGSRAVATRA